MTIDLVDRRPEMPRNPYLISPGDLVEMDRMIWKVTGVHYAADPRASEVALEPYSYPRVMEPGAPGLRVPLPMILRCTIFLKGQVPLPSPVAGLPSPRL